MKTNETQKTKVMGLISVQAVLLAALAVLMLAGAAQALWDSNDGFWVWRGGWGLNNPAAEAGKIYTHHSFGRLGVIDTATGEFTDVGPYGLPESMGLTATAFAPDGTLYGMVQGFFERGGTSRLVVLDKQTGKATPIGLANPINTVAMDIAPDGTAYVAGFEQPALAMKGDPNLYTIDTDTGQLTSIGSTGIDRIMDFAFDASGTMWATTGNELYTIDKGTGASAHVASITGVDAATNDPNAEIMGIMFDENDVLYATAFIEGSPLFTIDTITGQATAVAQPGLSFPHGGAIMNTDASDADNVIYVKADASGANDGTSWADAYNDLQYALAIAEAGNQIWVAAGTYKPGVPGVRTVTFRLKSGIGIYGGFAGMETRLSERDPVANETILSGDLKGDDVIVLNPSYLAEESTRSDNCYHVVTGSDVDETAVLDGFVITAGNADGSGNTNGGGMINIQSANAGRGPNSLISTNPTVSNCIFNGNYARLNGGGIYNEDTNPTVTNCTFIRNFSKAPGNFAQGGGGMYNVRSNPTVVCCEFIKNMAADDGAGMTNENSNPILINCTFRQNVCGGGPNIGVGGGMYNNNGSKPTLINCRFIENEAGLDGTGGGIFNQNGSHAILTNCTLIGNSTGPLIGYWADGGGGMFNQQGSRPIVTNCIFWGNRDDIGISAIAQISSSSYGVNTSTVTYSCVQGGWTDGIGNIGLDPLFMDIDGPDNIVGTADDDLRLRPGSPCIDAGDDIALPADIADLDGDEDMAEPIPFDLDKNLRIIGPRVDIGAYEYNGPAEGLIYTSHSFGQNLGMLDTVTGEFADVGSYGLPESTGMTATAFSPDGTLYGMIQGFFERGGMSQLAIINQQNGKATPVGFSNPINTVALDFAPDGTAYVAGFEEPSFAMEGDPNLYSIDTATGQLTSIGNTGINKIMDFAFDSSGTMWATTGNELYVIDTSTGASEHVLSITGVDTATNDPNAEIMGIMFDDNDVLYGTAFIEGSPLFTIDTNTGQATAVAQPGIFFPHGGAIFNTDTNPEGFIELWGNASTLVGRWPFDEADGEIAMNTADWRTPGLIEGDPLRLPNDGYIGGAIELDGIDDYISTDFVLDPSLGAFSALVWVKGGAPGQVIISQLGGAGNIWLGLDAQNGNLMTGLVSPSSGWVAKKPLVSQSIVTDDHWHHIAFVWDGSYRALYADGIEVVKDTAAQTPLKSSDGGLNFGVDKTLDSKTFFSGQIDDIRIYDIALTEEQIKEIIQ